jgi:hypothetical protein
MLQFIVFLILSWLTLRFLAKLFGGMLVRVALQRALERMQKQYINTQNAFQQKYDPEFDREILINPDLKVKMPRSDTKGSDNTKRTRRFIDDVDFEETRG